MAIYGDRKAANPVQDLMLLACWRKGRGSARAIEGKMNLIKQNRKNAQFFRDRKLIMYPEPVCDVNIRDNSDAHFTNSIGPSYLKNVLFTIVCLLVTCRPAISHI